jgi:O-antigen ligase
MAAVHAAHTALWVALALMMACGDWPASRLCAAFLAGVLMHAWVGLLQFALQHHAGLEPRFGELPIRIGDGWSSVVYAEAERLLRAYGLSGHPNALGGYVTIGLLLSYGLIIRWPRVWRGLAVIAWAIAWELLLITFSRSAWVGLAVGTLVAVALLARSRLFGRRALISAAQLAAVGAALAIVFTLTFWPFLSGRLQPTRPEDVVSIRERRDMINLAGEIIAARPWLGVGAANFSLASKLILGYPLDWVHHVPLLITSELGLPGLSAFLVSAGSLIVVVWRRWRSRSLTVWQSMIGGGVAAIAVVMFFDHYPWTAPQGALLWGLLAGWWMAD